MNDYAPLLERAFSLHLREESYRIERIEGLIPEYIKGNYYLNGPARFSVYGLSYRNWLDGDGMVCSLRFSESGVDFVNRFVRSAKFLAEAEAGRPLFRMFGTAFDGDQLKRGIATESPANVSVYPFGGKLLAFGEQSIPFELNPVTLETVAPCNFHGNLNDISPFSAHPKTDTTTGDLFNFGLSFSGKQPSLTLYRFNSAEELIFRKRHPIDYPCTTHDFGLSRDYAVFYLCPYLLDIQKLIRENRPTIDALTWEPERGSQLRLYHREDGEEANRLAFGNRYCLHLGNCFDHDGLLTVDLIEHDRPLYDQYQIIPDLFTTVSRGGPVRYVVDPIRGTTQERHEIPYYGSPDFPTVDPRFMSKACDHAWMLGISTSGKDGRKFLDQLVHVDWKNRNATDVYQAPPASYLGGEPIFIGDPAHETRGVILCQIFDAERIKSAFALFDAFCVEKGPTATLHLRHPVHLGFHAFFKAR